MAYPSSTDYEQEQIVMARFAKALSHPARISIMKHLSTMPDCCFTDIFNELPIAQATVSQHLSELKACGLIQGSIEPPKVKYCINTKNWEIAKELFGSFFESFSTELTNSCE